MSQLLELNSFLYIKKFFNNKIPFLFLNKNFVEENDGNIAIIDCLWKEFRQ